MFVIGYWVDEDELWAIIGGCFFNCGWAWDECVGFCVLFLIWGDVDFNRAEVCLFVVLLGGCSLRYQRGFVLWISFKRVPGLRGAKLCIRSHCLLP